MSDEMIALGSDLADELGFTAEKFEGWLWEKEGAIVVSFIVSKQPGKGHFGELLDAIWQRGLVAQVPTPLGQMIPILEAKGFEQKAYRHNALGMIEVWERGP